MGYQGMQKQHANCPKVLPTRVGMVQRQNQTTPHRSAISHIL